MSKTTEDGKNESRSDSERRRHSIVMLPHRIDVEFKRSGWETCKKR